MKERLQEAIEIVSKRKAQRELEERREVSRKRPADGQPSLNFAAPVATTEQLDIKDLTASVTSAHEGIDIIVNNAFKLTAFRDSGAA